MKMSEFLDLGIRLEETISACYEGLCRLSSDQALSWRLKKIAQEEKNHAQILESGKKYARMVPAAFGKEMMTAAEIKTGLRLASGLLKKIQKKSDLQASLKTLLKLEKRFEKVHLDTSIEIRDESLKKLFLNLSQEDKTHTQSLEEIISALDSKPS
jgi:rubrerythrin